MLICWIDSYAITELISNRGLGNLIKGVDKLNSCLSIFLQGGCFIPLFFAIAFFNLNPFIEVFAIQYRTSDANTPYVISYWIKIDLEINDSGIVFLQHSQSKSNFVQPS